MDKHQIVHTTNRSLECLEYYRREYFKTFADFGEAQGRCIFTVQDGVLQAKYFGFVMNAQARFVCVGNRNFFDQILFEWTSSSGDIFPVWGCYLDESGNVRLTTEADSAVFGWTGSPELCRKTGTELVLSLIAGAPMKCSELNSI